MVQTSYVLLLLFSLTFALAMALSGVYLVVWRDDRIRGAMQILTGIAIVGGLVLFQRGGVLSIFFYLGSAGDIGKLLALFSVVGALVSLDYFFARLLPLTTLVTEEDGSTDDTSLSRRSVLGLAFGGITASLLGGTTFVQASGNDSTSTTSSEFVVEATFDAQLQPTALAFDDGGSGYLTSLNGDVFRFDRPSDPAAVDSLAFEKTASGIQSPQAVEVLDGTLFTVDLGDAGEFSSGTAGRVENLSNSNAKVVAFDIRSDGSLANRRQILSELPVVNRDHSPNAIVAGPDGRLYLSVGHLGPHPRLMNDGSYDPSTDIHPNIDYLGTILSFEPDGSDLRIVARGLRNVYDIAFDRDGNLFGADNDGQTARSKVWNTLYHIVEDGHYGFPEYGTLDREVAEKDLQDALWVFDGIAPAGIETTDKLGYDDGVLVGVQGKIVFVPLARDDAGFFVPGFVRPEPSVVEMNGFPTIVEADPDGLLYTGGIGSQDIVVLRANA